MSVVGVGAIYAPSMMTTQAISMCDTYILRREIVQEISDEFPAFKQRIRAQNRVTIVFAVTTVSRVKQYFRTWTDVAFGNGAWMKERSRKKHRLTHESGGGIDFEAPSSSPLSERERQTEEVEHVKETQVRHEAMLDDVHKKLDLIMHKLAILQPETDPAPATKSKTDSMTKLSPLDAR